MPLNPINQPTKQQELICYKTEPKKSKFLKLST